MSILSARPDGLGFHHGFADGDHRQINVRCLGHHGPGNEVWVCYVGGKRVSFANTKQAAEEIALQWMHDNPPEKVEEKAE